MPGLCPGAERERMAKVLVVDDERGIRELLSDKLAEAGHEVIEAGDGQTALERAWQESPDVILLDVLMPVMDGLQALARLRQDPATEGIPVILLTAFSPLKGEQTAIELEAWPESGGGCARRLYLGSTSVARAEDAGRAIGPEGPLGSGPVVPGPRGAGHLLRHVGLAAGPAVPRRRVR